MTPGLLVHSAGPWCTVQDLGRSGFGRLGVAPAGALDPLLLRAANVLVGNAETTAALEWTVRGGVFEIQARSARVAVTGDCSLAIDGLPVAPWRSHRLTRGQRLSVEARGDLRGYLAIFGGFAIEPVLGSLSTHVRSALGGWQGRTLRDGDALPLRCDEAPPASELHVDLAALGARPQALRIVWGPQDDAFAADVRERLLSSTWHVSTHSDRMACRLTGPPLAHRSGPDIVSDGVLTGSIQVPGSGEPMVLLADRQTTGGYPKIATVISADLRHFAQLRPGEAVRFAAVDLDQAIALRAEQEARFCAWARSVAGPRPAPDAAADAHVLATTNLVSGVSDAADGPVV